MTTENQEQDKPLSVIAPKREVRVVVDDVAYIWDTARFEHMFRLASAMAAATLIPDHLKGNKHRAFEPEEVKANCFRIVNQALRWGVDPWSIVDDTYVVGGKLCYQSKVVAALINTHAPLKERLKKSYTGEGDDLTITISGTFIGEQSVRETTMRLGDVKTQNDMWKKKPHLKLWYSAVIQWAQEFTPELIVGIFTDDDADRAEQWKQERTAKTNIVIERPNFDQVQEAIAEQDKEEVQ